MGAMFSSEKLHLLPPRIVHQRVYPFLNTLGGVEAEWLRRDFLEQLDLVAEASEAPPPAAPPGATAAATPLGRGPVGGSAGILMREVSSDGQSVVSVHGSAQYDGSHAPYLNVVANLSHQGNVRAGAHVNTHGDEQLKVYGEVDIAKGASAIAGVEATHFSHLGRCSAIAGVRWVKEKMQRDEESPLSQPLSVHGRSSAASSASSSAYSSAYSSSSPRLTRSSSRGHDPVLVAQQPGVAPRRVQEGSEGGTGAAECDTLLFCPRGKDPRTTSIALYTRTDLAAPPPAPRSPEQPQPRPVVVGMLGSWFTDPLFLQAHVEADVRTRKVEKSEIALSWSGLSEEVEQKKGDTRYHPSYEFALKLENVMQDAVQSPNHDPPPRIIQAIHLLVHCGTHRTSQLIRCFITPQRVHLSPSQLRRPSLPSSHELTAIKPLKVGASIYRHIVVPRRVLVAMDSRYKLINNYIDLGLEWNVEATSTPKHSFAFTGGWQLNKNNLIKGKFSDSAVSASYTVKTWSYPRLALSVEGGYNFRSHLPLLAFNLELNTNRTLHREHTKLAYADAVGYTATTDVKQADRSMV